MTQPAQPQQPTTRQCYQWARSAHDIIAGLEEHAGDYLPATGGMDSDTADEIVAALAQAKTALATAFGVYMLTEVREQTSVGARYPAHQQTLGQPQYQATGAQWPQQ